MSLFVPSQPVRGAATRQPRPLYPRVQHHVDAFLAGRSESRLELLTFFFELKRRHVTKVACVYGHAGIGIVEAVNNFLPLSNLSAWTQTFAAALVLMAQADRTTDPVSTMKLAAEAGVLTPAIARALARSSAPSI